MPITPSVSLSGRTGKHSDLTAKEIAGIIDHADDSISLEKMEHGTHGDVLFYGSGGAPERLPAGADGRVLTTHGAGANPTWEVGGVGGAHANTHHSGGTDEVYWSLLEHSAGDPTAIDEHVDNSIEGHNNRIDPHANATSIGGKVLPSGSIVGTTDPQMLFNKMLGTNLDANAYKITQHGLPTENSDVANKLYVDTQISATGLNIFRKRRYINQSFHETDRSFVNALFNGGDITPNVNVSGGVGVSFRINSGVAGSGYAELSQNRFRIPVSKNPKFSTFFCFALPTDNSIELGFINNFFYPFGPEDGAFFSLGAGGFHAYTRRSGEFTSTALSPISVGTWYMLGVDLNPSRAIFYVNGNIVATHTTNIPLTDVNFSLYNPAEDGDNRVCYISSLYVEGDI